MVTIVHEFTITRSIRGESNEIELKASFEIEPSIESAELVGIIFLVDGELPWDGRLTKRERERIEIAAYNEWSNANETTRHSTRDDSCVVDSAFDSFDDDMGLKVMGRGEIFW
jgi:hypothetical protein